MGNYATMLFNKVIENNDVQAIKRLNLKAEHFIGDTDRKTYEFIVDYAHKNSGQSPSYATVVTELPSFIHVAGVDDNYDFLARKILNESAASKFASVYENISSEFSDAQSDMQSLITRLTDDLSRIKMETDVRKSVGTSVKNNPEFAVLEYEKRKNGESAREWTSSFPKIKSYTAGDMYVFYGKSGRGKSVITLREAVHLAEQGATVLIWSMEMTTYKVLARLYPMLSADAELKDQLIGGKLEKAGFDADGIRRGSLSDDDEQSFISFVYELLDALEGDIIIRGVDDDDFHDRSLSALESDILRSQADVVVVDPFYYLDYEKNTSKTTGGDAANTSKRLRRLTGTHSIVTLAITQADESDQHETDDGVREISLPKRSEVSKTKALLQDASQLVAIDTDYAQFRGLVGLNKGRDGGEGLSEEILYAPQFGLVRPLSSLVDVADFRENGIF